MLMMILITYHDDDNLHCERTALNQVLISANCVEVAIKIRADAIRLNALGKPNDDWIMSAHAQIVIYTLLQFTCF